jgi:hypothetical protein
MGVAIILGESVIPIAAKNVRDTGEILRCDQNDRFPGFFYHIPFYFIGHSIYFPVPPPRPPLPVPRPRPRYTMPVA